MENLGLDTDDEELDERKPKKASDSEQDSSDEHAELDEPSASGHRTPPDARPGSPRRSSIDEPRPEHLAMQDPVQTLEASQAKLARMEKASNPSRDRTPKPEGKLVASTINYGANTVKAATELGINPGSLQSRKPHTKLGTGSSGTDHQRADGNAARRARNKVQDKIEDKTGVRMKEGQYLKQKEKEATTHQAQNEKRQDIVRRQIAVMEQDREDFKKWLALLIPDTDRQKEESRGNTVPPKMPKQKSSLEKKAKEKGWPLTWDTSLLQELYRN